MERKKGEGKKTFSWSKPMGYHQDTNIWLYFSTKLTYFFSHQVKLILVNLNFYARGVFYFSTSDYKWDILLKISLELLLDYYN